MVTKELVNPSSIVVVGASNDIRKPGGKILKNILDGNFNGELYASNHKEDEIQGVYSFRNPGDLPKVDLAILAIPARFCPEVVRTLSHEKGTRAFIIISAGFSETCEEGLSIEQEIVEILEETGSCLIGPNCIGVINSTYNGCFTLPIPKLDSNGADFISASGATAVYVMESSIPNGLTFSSVFSVGNSAQLGVEDILAYLDESFDPAESSKVKLLYMEDIKKPQKLLLHARSLIAKGCRIACVKAGRSDAGSRAASSHTGALANSDLAVSALFEKAGIVRCNSREELAAVGGIFMNKELKGKNIAIITHAGGPAVMLTDVLSEGGLNVPLLEGQAAEELLSNLHPGSSTSNPIDILATGNVDQLRTCIDFVDQKMDNVDGMVVIFGSPGLFSVESIYELIHEKMESASKPVFPVLPSVINAREEIQIFLNLGRVNFPDEVVFGRALAKVFRSRTVEDVVVSPPMDKTTIRSIIENSEDGYLNPSLVQKILDATGIKRVGEFYAQTLSEAVRTGQDIGYPLVMKVVGPVHKTDVGGVSLNINDEEEVEKEFKRLMNIAQAKGVLIQPFLNGLELFVGAKAEAEFGHMVLCGMGGIYIEVLKDVQTGLAPLGKKEISNMICSLKAYPLLVGVRGSEGVDVSGFEDIVNRISTLVGIAPEIMEMDLNPLIATSQMIACVDARIRIKN